MARKTPLIPPGSVLSPRETEPETESVLDDVLGAHRRRKGIDPPAASSDMEVQANADQEKIVRKKESQKERNLSNKQEGSLEPTLSETNLVEAAMLCSTRPTGELIPWGTRLPKVLKKRLDYQAFRLKDHKISGQGLTILALERLLAELEAIEQEG